MASLDKLELYIDIANANKTTGTLDLSGDEKNVLTQVTKLLALIKEKDYANINIMCLDTSTNALYIYFNSTSPSSSSIDTSLKNAKTMYNTTAFAAPTSKVDKPALVFIEKKNTDLLAKESFKTNILANKKAIIIQYDDYNLLPIIIILSLIAYNSLDNDVINGIATRENDRRYLADIRLDFADTEAYLKNNNNTTARPAKLERLEKHAEYLQMVPKLAEIKELEVITPQFEAKATKNNMEKNKDMLKLHTSVQAGGALRTDMPDPMSIVHKILNVLGAVIIPKEVAKLVINAKKRKPEYFQTNTVAANEVSLSKILEYVVQSYTQKKTAHFNDNTEKRKTDLHKRQWKFLKEPKNISKIRYCKLAIDHIKRRFGNERYTVIDDLDGSNRDLYEKIMRYDITYGVEHTFPQAVDHSIAGTIHILLMDKEKTANTVADADYIGYVTELLNTNNGNKTIMLYSKESIGTLKLLFKNIPKAPTKADYDYMFKNMDRPGHKKRGVVSRLKEGARQTKKALARLAGRYSSATKNRKRRSAMQKEVNRIGIKKSEDGLQRSYTKEKTDIEGVKLPSDIAKNARPENVKRKSRIEDRKAFMNELKNKLTELPKLKAKGEDIIGYRALSVTELNALVRKYGTIMQNETYKMYKTNIPKDLGITLSDDALTKFKGTIQNTMYSLYTYYLYLVDIVNASSVNKEYKLNVDGKDYELKVSKGSSETTVTFPYPTNAKDLTTMRDNIEKLQGAAIKTRLAAQDAARLAAQEKATRLAAQEEARRTADEEAARRTADEEEAARLAADEEEAATKIQAAFRGIRERKLQKGTHAAATTNAIPVNISVNIPVNTDDGTPTPTPNRNSNSFKSAPAGTR